MENMEELTNKFDDPDDTNKSMPELKPMKKPVIVHRFDDYTVSRATGSSSAAATAVPLKEDGGEGEREKMSSSPEEEEGEKLVGGGGGPAVVKLPQKRFYRQRAHSNPLSDHDLIYPVSPDQMNWDNLLGPSARGQVPEFADIGCGYGGLLVRLAPLFPDTAMVGMEIRVKVSDFVQQKIAALRAKSLAEREIGNDPLPPTYDNICCLRTNAMKLLPKFFRRGQLSKMFFLYPDPHFKSAKHKWRIISPSLLTEYAFFLRPGGVLYTITDVEELHHWMVKHLSEHSLFERYTEAELAADPVVPLLSDSSEEGQKVTRNAGQKWPAVFRRRENPPPIPPLSPEDAPFPFNFPQKDPKAVGEKEEKEEKDD